MNRESHSMIGGLSKQETSLVGRHDEMILLEELEDSRRRERTIARLRLLWLNRGFLFDIFLVGLVVSVTFAFLIPSRYESSTRLMPPDAQAQGLGILGGFLGRMGGEGGSSGSLSSLASTVLGLKTSGDLFIGVLGSRAVQDELVKKFDLRKVYGFYHWEDSWKGARKTLEDRTDVSVDKKSGIITITVTDLNPNRAAAMAQEYVAQLDWIVTSQNTSSAHRERVFLEGRLAQVRQDLETAENEFSQFASKNTAINVPEQGKAMITAAAELQGQLIAAQTQLESLRQIYTDDNVRVREAHARVDELRKELGRIGGQPVNNISDAKEPDIEAIYPSIRQLPVLGVTYADLYRRIKVEEAVFETLTQEYELAKIEEVKETPSVKVLDPANVPENKSFPPRGTIIFGGAVLAGLFGTLWLFGNESWSLLGPQDPRKILATEVADSIRPLLSSYGSNGAARTRTNSVIWDWITNQVQVSRKN